MCHGLFGPELGGLQRCLVGLPRAAGAPECGEVLPEAGLACLVLQYLRCTCFLPALSGKQTGVGIPLQNGNGVGQAVFQCLQRRDQRRKPAALRLDMLDFPEQCTHTVADGRFGCLGFGVGFHCLLPALLPMCRRVGHGFVLVYVPTQPALQPMRILQFPRDCCQFFPGAVAKEIAIDELASS